MLKYFIRKTFSTLIGRIYIAEEGFDPPTSGLWAQHASAAPLCCLSDVKNYKYIPDDLGLYWATADEVDLTPQKTPSYDSILKTGLGLVTGTASQIPKIGFRIF